MLSLLCMRQCVKTLGPFYRRLPSAHPAEEEWVNLRANFLYLPLRIKVCSTQGLLVNYENIPQTCHSRDWPISLALGKRHVGEREDMDDRTASQTLCD